MTDEPPHDCQRQQILNAAARLFAERGFGNTGMRDLAREAGVSLSMINYHFGSKAGLLEQTVAHFQEAFLAVAREALTSHDTTEQKVRAYVRGIVGLARERPCAMRVALRDLPQETPTMPACKAARLRQLPILVKRELLDPVGKGAQLHFLGPGIVKLITSHFYIRPMAEAVLGPMPDDDAFYDKYCETISDLILYGLLGGPGCVHGPE